MATEAAVRSNRPRPWLLIALAVVVGLFVVMKMGPSNPAPSTPSPQRTARGAGPQASVDPEDLKVELEALKLERPAVGEMERNPFRFQPRVEPPPVVPPGAQKSGSTGPTPPPPPPPPPSGPPPIPLKFIGVLEAKPVGKIAAFSDPDCRATFQGREGSVIDGRYRLVRIGVQSVEMEYLDGRGRQSIRMTGQECVGR